MPDRMLALDRLVKGRLSDLGIKPPELVRRWGYANTSKGLRRLDQLRAGQFLPDARGVAALAAALEVKADVLRLAFEITRQQLDDRRAEEAEQEWQAWCRRFQPHAILRTDQQRPSPVFVAALLGPERLLRIDIDPALPPLTWPSRIAAKLPAHVPAFGKVIGFYLNYAPDRAVAFDRAGTPVGERKRAVRPGHAWIEHKGRDITPGWQAVLCRP